MRDIHELIWHCTATPEGREVSKAEIIAWHQARGFSTIGYHRIIHLDGSWEQGRPFEMVGAHVSGHNEGTIGYSYVGGTDKAGVPKDTRTAAQKATMLQLTKEAITQFKLRKVTGHREYAAKACPCFDAYGEYNHLINNEQPTTGAVVGAGLANDRLKYLQSLLRSLHYDLGMIDGLWGPKTKAAVYRFQADNDLPNTGELDTETVAKLRSLAE